MSALVEPMNGRPQRKQLSDQIDRLDGIIDCLADALPEAVRDAVRDGTQAALQQLIHETLSNPEIVEQLRRAIGSVPNVPVPNAQVPSRKAMFLARCRAGLAALKDRAKHGLAAGMAFVKSALVPVQAMVAQTVAKVQSLVALGRLAWHLKRAALVGVALGGVVAVVSLISHPIATALSGVGAAVTAFTVQVALRGYQALQPWRT